MKCTPERRISTLFPFRNEFLLSWWWLGEVWKYQAWKQWSLQLIRKLGARRTTFLFPSPLNAASFEGGKFFKFPFVFMTQQRRPQWFHAYISLPLAFALCWPSTWYFIKLEGSVERWTGYRTTVLGDPFVKFSPHMPGFPFVFLLPSYNLPHCKDSDPPH